MKSKILIFPIMFSIFVWVSSVLMSHFYFSKLPLLETFFLSSILHGTLFVFVSSTVISLLVYKNRESNCFNLVPMVILQIDRSGKIIFINNYLREELKQRNIDIKGVDNILELKEYIEEEDEFVKLFEHLLKNPEAYIKFFDSFSTIDGSFFKVTVIGVSKKRITLIGTNETQYKSLKNEIVEKDLLYKKLIDVIPLPIGYRYIDGSSKFENNEFKKIIKNNPDNSFEEYLKYKDGFKNVIDYKKSQSFNLRLGNKIYEVNQSPLFKNDKLNGVICFCIDKTKDFVNKKQSEERIKFQNSLYKVQRLLLKLDNKNFNEYIYLILEEISSYIQSDAVYFYEISDLKRMNFYEHKKSYSPSFIDKVKNINPSAYSEFIERFENGDEFITNNSFELKTSTDDFFNKLSVVSLLEKSLYGKNFKGILGFCNFTKTHKWSKLETSFIRIIGEILLNSIERVLTEKDLSESEETFKILTENSPLGVVIFDLNYRTDNIYYINKEAEDCLGYRKEDLNKIEIEDIITEDFQDVFKQLLSDREKCNNRAIIQVKNGDSKISLDVGLKEIKITGDKFSKHILVSMINLDKAMNISNRDD